MHARRRSGWRVPFVLGLACAGLGWMTYEQVRVSPTAPARADVAPAQPADLAMPKPMPQFAMPPLEAFAAVVERPIFSPDRRPPAAEAALKEDSAAPQAVLTGIIIAESERIALVRTEADGRIVRLRPGQRVDGWRLVAVEPDRAMFRRGEAEVILELAYDESSPAPPQRPRRRASSGRADTEAEKPSADERREEDREKTRSGYLGYRRNP